MRARITVAAAGLLGALLVLELALSVSMLGARSELMFGEALVYGHARRLLEGVALYQPVDRFPYSVTTYPPMAYAPLALLQVVSQGFGAGRALALLSVLVSGGLVGVLAGGGRVGVLAALTFLALGVPGSGPIPWTALYKEDSLALAFALGAVVVARRSGGSLLAGGLAALAMLTKQTLAPLALAPALWLLWSRDVRGLVRFGAAAIVPVAFVSAGFELATGGAYLDNLLLAQNVPNSGEWLRSNVQLLLLFQVGPLLAAGAYWAAGRGRSGDDRLLGVAWLGACVPLVVLAKVGGGSNHWMPFAALVAVFAARAAWCGRVASIGLLIGVLVSAIVAAPVWLASLEAPRHGDELASLVQRARATSGEVLSDPLDVAVLAGREPWFDPLAFGRLEAGGIWPAAPILDRVCSGQLELVVLGQPIETVEWPASVRSAVARSVRLEGRVAERYVYVRDTSASAC